MFKRLKQMALVLAVFVGAMIIVGVLVDAVLPRHWQPVQASVQSANIASIRMGTPEWAIQADARYEFHGRVYETRRDVFVDADRDVALDALDDWQDEQAAEPDSADDELDFIIREGGNIMADMLELDQRMASILAPKQITAQANTLSGKSGQ